ncbi:MAG: hypothetical protein OXE52_11785 [Chloroflexi bacterium]|nr:hypothetical protein [Chloroflexota bacterium]
MERIPVTSVRTGILKPHTVVHIKTDMTGEKAYISQREKDPSKGTNVPAIKEQARADNRSAKE